jgi:hypothetical protein
VKQQINWLTNKYPWFVSWDLPENS